MSVHSVAEIIGSSNTSPERPSPRRSGTQYLRDLRVAEAIGPDVHPGRERGTHLPHQVPDVVQVRIRALKPFSRRSGGQSHH